jgi:hypothetical protein
MNRGKYVEYKKGGPNPIIMLESAAASVCEFDRCHVWRLGLTLVQSAWEIGSASWLRLRFPSPCLCMSYVRKTSVSRSITR